MPRVPEISISTPAERRRAVAAILAKGVIRWRRVGGDAAVTAADSAPESPPNPRNGLELMAGSRPCGRDGTHGLCLRADGDDA